jgi:hypothetical protein
LTSSHVFCKPAGRSFQQLRHGQSALPQIVIQCLRQLHPSLESVHLGRFLSAPTMFNIREHHISMVSPRSHWCQLKSHSSRASVAAMGTVVAGQQDTNTTLLSKDFLQPTWSPLTTRHCPSCEQPDFYRTPPWTVPTCARPRCHLTERGGQMSTTFGFLFAMSVPVR